jgi:hypothetical protein
MADMPAWIAAGNYQVQVQIVYDADSNPQYNQQNKAFTVAD